jgi:hypothetical protein
MTLFYCLTALKAFRVTSPLRLTISIFFQLNTCCHSPYVTSCLMRGWVFRLQLLLAFASAVVLRPESRGTHDHILLSQIRDLPAFISPRHWVRFSAPHATRRDTGLSYLIGTILRTRNVSASPGNVAPSHRVSRKSPYLQNHRGSWTDADVYEILKETSYVRLPCLTGDKDVSL